MADNTESWIEKLGNENPMMLLILGAAIGAGIFFLITKFMVKK
jgi:hypothetical protein